MPRPIKLLIVPLLLIALAPAPATAQPISGAEAIDAMKEVLRARGLTPPPESGLSLDDYIETNLDERGRRNVRLGVGPDGHIIPSPEWQTYHPTYCMQRARYMESAGNVLNFRASRNTEERDGLERTQTFTFVQFIDAGTLVIEEQREGEEGPDPDSRGLVATMSDAWDQLTVPIGGLTGPCGEVRVRHVGGTDVGDEFVFLAGFQGTYGRYLNYTWDFGDGSAPVSVGERARHVYDAEGTYEVSVLVEGENTEPAVGTVTVDVGDKGDELPELVVSFESALEVQSDYTRHMRVAGAVELSPDYLSAAYYHGSGTLRYEAYSESSGSQPMELKDGVLQVDDLVFPPMQEASDGIELGFQFAPEPMEGELAQFMGFFELMHRDELDPISGTMWRSMEWDREVGGDVMARKVYDRSATFYNGAFTVTEKTTLTIRRKSP